MNFILLTVFVHAVLYIPDTLAFKWTDTVPEQVSACVGKPAVFSWNFAVDTETDSVLSTTWFGVVNGHTQDLVKARVREFDFGKNAVPNQVAALKLKSAALRDAGTYIVNVTYVTKTESGKQFLTASRSAELIVWKAPSTTDDQLHAVLDPKAVKIQTGKTSEWRGRLSCGTFLGLGQPNVSVVWKAPSDKTLPSTSYDRGAFHLDIDRTEAGLYSCQIDPKAPALTCLDPNSFLLSNVDVYVNQADVRLLVLEAQNAKQEAQLAKQEASIAELRKRLKKSAKSVSFHAWINNKLYKARDTLTTSRTFNNDGNAYNEASGVFTVPVNGTYIFLANVMVQSDSPRKINDGVFIYVDGKDHGRCWSSYKSHYEQGSCHAIVKLRAGQRVWLHNYYSNSRYYPDSSSFSGALLHADLS